MTIAACYVSRGGVVLGADSTATYQFAGNSAHYNNTQKIFEIGGPGSPLGLVTWGLAGLPGVSYRQLSAELGDYLLDSPPANVEQAAKCWCDQFGKRHSEACQEDKAAYDNLVAKPLKTAQERELMLQLRRKWFVGFCIGGHTVKDRTPSAFTCQFSVDGPSPDNPIQIVHNSPVFWGMPSIMDRILLGIDGNAYRSILNSSLWQGNKADLDSLIGPSVLRMQIELPLRDAIDWIYSSIFMTIKAMKFSAVPPSCGGPIEVALISADRPFRWVSHKGLDQALGDHHARRTFQ